MNRLQRTFKELGKAREKALTIFLTAGFPKLNSTIRNVLECQEAGADIVELGMPFSDPLADGPVIQRSSSIALKNGMNLRRLFSSVYEIRKRSEIPIILMGYINPVLSYGTGDFFSRAGDVGVDGVIFPEIPLEGSATTRSLARQHGIAHIMLVSPTTSSVRIARIDQASSGFVYCVSTTGVTGKRPSGDNAAYLKRTRANIRKNPMLVGFGIASAEDVSRVGKHCDGVIVGSALLKRLERTGSAESVKPWIRSLKRAL